MMTFEILEDKLAEFHILKHLTERNCENMPSHRIKLELACELHDFLVRLDLDRHLIGVPERAVVRRLEADGSNIDWVGWHNPDPTLV